MSTLVLPEIPLSPCKSSSPKRSPCKRGLFRQRSRSFDSSLDPTTTTETPLDVPSSDKKRVLKRGEIMDDSMVGMLPLPMLLSPITTTSSLVAKKSPVRTSTLQMSFVRVHVGFKSFHSRVNTVAVAIHLQPTLLLYEVVVADVVETKELSRLYVYQSEIEMQLRQRKAILEQRKELSMMPLQWQCPEDYSVVDNKPGTRQNRVRKAKARSRRRTDSELSKILPRPEETLSLRRYLEDSVLNLDSIDVHSLSEEKSLRSIIPRIIVQCLQLSRSGNSEYKFCLVNDVRQSTFMTHSSIPTELHRLLPTTVDICALISHAENLENIESATSALKKVVGAADASSTRVTFSELEEEEMSISKRFQQEDNVNPNRLKWRTLWQSAIRSVMIACKKSKDMQQHWSQVVDGAMEHKRMKDETVLAMLAQERPAGFRSLRAKRHGVMTESHLKGAPMSVEEIDRYRDEIAAKRREKKDTMVSKTSVHRMEMRRGV